jgi:hypothetical protein
MQASRFGFGHAYGEIKTSEFHSSGLHTSANCLNILTESLRLEIPPRPEQ